MIYTVILPGILYAHHITHALHHADQIVVTRPVGTYGTHLIVRYHTALTAIFHLIPQVDYSLGEMMNILLRLLQKMKSQPESTPATDTGEGADSVHGFFKKLGWVVFLI